MAYHLAQFNIGRMLAPVESPIMADFVNNLEYINTIADQTPGFVWRLKSDNGNATSIKIYEDDLIIINMSVWESIETLHQYVYASEHVNFFRRRKAWFERMKVYMTLWWIPAGHIPTPQEAQERLAYMEAHGVTPYAFTFKERFTAQEALAYTAV
jgi:hypothetical protein